MAMPWEENWGTQSTSVAEKKPWEEDWNNPVVEKKPWEENWGTTQPEQVSAIGAAGREVAAGVLPMVGGRLAGGAAGAAAGLAFGPVGAVVGGLGGAILGATGVEKLQEKVAPLIVGEKNWEEFQAKRAAGQEQHPYASLGGSFGAMALGGRLKLNKDVLKVIPQIKSLSKLTMEQLRQPENAEAINNIVNVAVGTGMMTGMEAYNQIKSGNFDAVKMALATAGGAALSKPWGKGGVPKPETPAEVTAQVERDAAFKAAVEPTIQSVPTSIDNRSEAMPKPTLGVFFDEWGRPRESRMQQEGVSLGAVEQKPWFTPEQIQQNLQDSIIAQRMQNDMPNEFAVNVPPWRQSNKVLFENNQRAFQEPLMSDFTSNFNQVPGTVPDVMRRNQPSIPRTHFSNANDITLLEHLTKYFTPKEVATFGGNERLRLGNDPDYLYKKVMEKTLAEDRALYGPEGHPNTPSEETMYQPDSYGHMDEGGIPQFQPPESLPPPVGDQPTTTTREPSNVVPVSPAEGAKTDLMKPKGVFEGWKVGVNPKLNSRAVVDWESQKIILKDPKDLKNREVILHEVGHVLFERKLENADDFWSAYEKAFDVKPVKGENETQTRDWMIKNKFHKEKVAIDFADWLSGKPVNDQLHRIFSSIERSGDRYVYKPTFKGTPPKREVAQIPAVEKSTQPEKAEAVKAPISKAGTFSEQDRIRQNVALKAKGLTDLEIEQLSPADARQRLLQGPGSPEAGGESAGIQEALGVAKENIASIAKEGKPVTRPIESYSFWDYVKSEIDRTKQEGLSTLDQALTGMKAGWKYMVKLTSAPPKNTPLIRAITRHEGEYGQAEEMGRQFYKDMKKAIPDQRTWNAISVWRDAGGNPEILAEGFNKAPSIGKQAYADALKLTDQEKSIAMQIKQYTDTVGEELQKRGLIDKVIRDYLRRTFKIKDDTTLEAVFNKFKKDVDPNAMTEADRINATISGDVGGMAKARVFNKDYEAMLWAEQISKESGVKVEVEQDALKRMLSMDITAKKALADAELLESMKMARESDGKISMVDKLDLNEIERIGKMNKSKNFDENIRTYLDNIKADLKAQNNTLSEMASSKDDSVKANIPDIEAKIAAGKSRLAKTQRLYDTFKGSIPELKNYVWVSYPSLPEAWVHPNALRHVRAMFELSRLRGSLAMKVSSEFKQAMLSASAFHPVQLAIHGLEHRVMPWKLVEKLDFSGESMASKEMINLSNSGLIHTATDELNAIMEGVTGGGGIFSRIPVLGERMGAWNRWIFENFQPRLKMTMALHALERNKVRFAKDIVAGKMSQFQLYRLTAEQANAAFGGVNYKLLGRNPTFQDQLRLMLLAPDFLEARTRFASQALTKYGTEQREALALGAATLYVTARIMNLMLDGRPHLEKENMFSIVYNGKAYSLRTLQGDILQAVTALDKFVLGRVNPVTLRPALEMVTGRDFFGRERTLSQQAKDLITTAVPISLRGFMPDVRRQEGFIQILGASFGFGAKRYQETTRIYKKVDKWKKANNIQPRGEFIYDPDKDPYRNIKLALSDGDTADAIAGIRDYLKLPQIGPIAKTEGQKLAELTNHFYKYATSPFTGSFKNEWFFVKSLSDEDKAAYSEAKQEKLKIFREFIKTRNTYLAERIKPLSKEVVI